MSLVPYKRNIAEEKKILEELLKESPAGDGLPEGSAVFSITKTDKYFCITGIPLENTNFAYDFDRKYDPSIARTQKEWGKLKDQVRPKGEFYAGTAPEYYAILKTLHENRNTAQFKSIIEEARTYLQDVLKQQNPYILTLSRAKYNPAGLDEIVHDFGTKEEQPPKPAKLTGPNGYITDKKTKAQEYCQAILDTTDTVEQISEVFKWVTGKETYAWRISQPQNQQDRVVALGVNNVGDGFDVNSNDGIDGSRPALGVRRAKNFA
jgi:hypothetical protein